jgi:hypothetical protein
MCLTAIGAKRTWGGSFLTRQSSLVLVLLAPISQGIDQQENAGEGWRRLG